MRTRWLVVWLTVSVLLNALLLLAWIAELNPVPTSPRIVFRPPTVTNLFRPVRTNLVFAPRLLTWQDIESADYATYVGNLRAIGCPEPTVRDIVVADVNALFARRSAAEVPDPAQQWWRSEPDPDLVARAATNRAELDTERRNLLTFLLGPNWESADPTSADAQGNPLDGELLGSLSDETRSAVRQIEHQNRDRLEALTRAAQDEGKEVNATDLARLERQTRDELAKVLSPAELEEYLLRYSRGAARLRKQLRGFEATPEEFRQLFRATDAIDQHILDLASATDAASQQRRTQLERQREQVLEKELGPGRYANYLLNQDPVFQETQKTAKRLGVSAEKLIPFYRVNQVAQEERQRVLADTTLSPEEQTRELADLYEQQLATLRTLLGEEAFQKLQTNPPP